MGWRGYSSHCRSGSTGGAGQRVAFSQGWDMKGREEPERWHLNRGLNQVREQALCKYLGKSTACSGHGRRGPKSGARLVVLRNSRL